MKSNRMSLYRNFKGLRWNEKLVISPLLPVVFFFLALVTIFCKFLDMFEVAYCFVFLDMFGGTYCFVENTLGKLFKAEKE